MFGTRWQGSPLHGSDEHSVAVTEPLSLLPEATLSKQDNMRLDVSLTLEGSKCCRILGPTLGKGAYSPPEGFSQAVGH